jgi:predicted MFS family arabinose efflux permease
MKNYLFSRKFRKFDIILLILFSVLLSACVYLRLPFEQALSKEKEIELGYIGREYNDRYYVIDAGHSRLICFDENSKELYSIVDPSDNGESILYIDDFMVNDENLYLSVSEWNGMLLDRELIMKYDLEGNYIENVTENVYGGTSFNKHSFYGLTDNNGSLLVGENKKDQIIIHNITPGRDEGYSIAYPNAYNAVSDLAFDGEKVIVLDKNGTINVYEKKQPTMIYSTLWKGEENRIPFRLAVKDGTVYFTDIKNGEVVKVDTANESSETVIEATGSQTVTICPENDDLLTTDYDGLKRYGSVSEEFLVLEKNDDEIRTGHIFLGCFALLALISVIFIVRLVLIFTGLKLDATKVASFTIVIVEAVVLVVISVILLQAFRTSYLDKIREQLQATAIIVSESIDEDDISGVRQARDFNSEHYNNLVDRMERALPLSVDFYKTAYCNILKLSDDGTSGHGIAYLDQSIGVYFPLDETEYAEVKEVYESGRSVWNDAVEDVSGTYLSVKVPVYSADNKVIGVVAVGSDTYVVSDMISVMLRNVLFSIVIIMLLLWVMTTEGISFFNIYTRYQEKRESGLKSAVPVHLIRLLVFLVFTAFNMASSFLPIYVMKGSELFAGSNVGILASLPLTINIFIMGVMSLVASNLVRRYGIRNIFSIACLSSMCGNLILLIPNYFTIVLGLIMDGIGVGLISNSIYIMLTYLNDEQERNDCLNNYNAASLSGINMGMIIGGLLATAIGQRYVFIFVALTWFALAALAVFLAKKLESVITTEEETVFTGNDRLKARSFIRNRVILSFFALIQNPYIIFNSFVFYFIPIIAGELGYSETIISVLLMLYSEVAVIIGSRMSDATDKAFGDYAMYLALGLNIIAFAAYISLGNLAGIIVGLLIMGISASFGKPAQQSYFLKQKVTIDYGQDNAMGVYNFSENIGESLGPIVFGRLIGVAFGTNMAFLGVIFAMGLLHFIINRKDMNNGKQ